MYDGAGASVGRIEHSGANFDISNTATSTATMTFTTGSGSGSERMRIDSSGRVGIGTSSPATALDVNGTINVRTSGYQFGRITTNNVDTNNGGLTFQTISGGSFSERMRIDSSGNVGIGTSSPDTSLHVAGVAKASLGFQFGNSYLYEGATDQANMRIGTDGPYLEFIDAGSGVAEVGNASGPLALTANGTERMRIDSSGNVGIGTSGAAEKLRVVGTSGNPQFGAGTSQNGVFINAFDSNPIYMTASATNSTAFGLGSASNIPLLFMTNNTEHMRILTDGSIGINSTNTSSLLTVGNSYDYTLGSTSGDVKNALDLIYDTTNSDYLRFYAKRESNGSTWEEAKHVIERQVDATKMGQIKFGSHTVDPISFGNNNSEFARFDGIANLLLGKTSTAINPMGCMLKPNGQIFATTNGSDSFHNYDTSQNRYEFYVKGNGGIANYSSNNVNLSDETEKKNITAAASAWDDVKGLSLKEFHYIFEDDADPKQLGVIAQDVQVNHPELIKSFKIDDDTDKLGVVEQQITWMAIKALQEAITKIEDLEARVATLEGN